MTPMLKAMAECIGSVRLVDLVDTATYEVVRPNTRLEQVDSKYYADGEEVRCTVFPCEPELVFIGDCSRWAYAPAGMFA